MPRIGIIGRQNVGKSTLFNALLGRRVSIAYDRPGVTRDLVTREVDWGEGRWSVTDFPGLEKSDSESNDPESASIRHAMNELKQFHLLLWVVHRSGPAPYDYTLRDLLIKSGIETWLVVNYVDDTVLEGEAAECYSLGIEKVFMVSALNKRGIKDLRLQLRQKFTSGAPAEEAVEQNDEPVHDDTLNLVLLGKPNAGKSTLFNRFLSKDKAVVSPVAGTTRDAVEETFTYYGRPVRIIDTAGLRKKRQVHDDVEFYSTARTREALRRADAALLLVNPDEGFDRQNRMLLEEITASGTPFVVAINKEDLLSKYDKAELQAEINESRRLFFDFPVFFISALNGRKVSKALEKLFELRDKLLREVPTAVLNSMLATIGTNPVVNANNVKLNYITRAHPEPRLILFGNRSSMPKNVHRYLEKEFRKHLDWHELPLIIETRSKHGRRSEAVSEPS